MLEERETEGRVTEILEMLLIATSVWSCCMAVTTETLIFQTR